MLDDLGNSFDVAHPPQRIVSLVPSLTEYLFWLGAGDHVVGVTDFCIAPADRVASIPKVGGTKNPNRALIESLQPDFIIANKEENRERDVLALRERGMTVYITDINSVRDAQRSLLKIGQLLKHEDRAQTLIAEIQHELDRTPTQQIRIAAAIWRDPWMWLGANTYANDVLACCGGMNVVQTERYPRMTLDEIAMLQPDMIFLPSEPYHFSEHDLADVAQIAPSAMLCDGELLTWYGHRIPQALRTFRGILGLRN